MYHVKVRGYKGKWSAIDSTIVRGLKLYMMEHDTHEDEIACIIIDENKKVILDEVYNKFEHIIDLILEELDYIDYINKKMLAFEIDESKKVEVYYNLHRKCLSVRQSGKVVGHVDSIELHSAEFVVREAGRQRVLREKVKNVHAFVRGYLVQLQHVPNYAGCSGVKSATYNPYKYSKFVDAYDTKRELLGKSYTVEISGTERAIWYVNKD